MSTVTAEYAIADHSRVVGLAAKPPHITTQSAGLYARLTPYRVLAVAWRELGACKHLYGATWGYDAPQAIH